jgi:MoaA/NifB/PqqE/SkfB family radical SAM enzyme
MRLPDDPGIGRGPGRSRPDSPYEGKWMALLQGSREPMIGSVEITDACNLRCRHCFLNGQMPRPHELGVEAWRTVLRREFHGRGIRRISISGGEPLLRPDVIRMILEEGFHPWVLTNGTLPLPDLPLTYSVSIDGTEASHDAIRGPGSYRITSRNVLGAPHDGVFLNMTITTLNKDDPAAVVSQWKGKVRKISFGFSTPVVEQDPLWVPFGRERDAVVAGLLELKAEHPDFLLNTERQLRLMGDGAWAECCPSWILLCLDAAGGQKRCAFGDRADCRRCGADVYTAISSGLDGDVFEWMQNISDLTPELKRPST